MEPDQERSGVVAMLIRRIPEITFDRLK